MADDVLVRLEAHHEIAELKYRYVRALEERDWDGWADCFTEDASARFMPSPGETDAVEHRTREVLRHWVEGALEGVYAVIRVSMPTIRLLDATHATAEWAQVERLAFVDGPVREVTYYGYYHDTCEKGADGSWRIASVAMTRFRNDRADRDGTTTVQLDVVDRLARAAG